MSETLSYAEAIAGLREATPFEGSRYEMNAIAVYEHGLNCDGERVYWTLEEAIADYRKDYERDIEETAIGIANDPNVRHGNRWLPLLFGWARPFVK